MFLENHYSTSIGTGWRFDVNPMEIDMTNMKHLIDTEMKIEDDTFRVLAVGTVEAGRVYLHLASTTKFTQAKNGKHYRQIADWFPLDQLK